MLSRSIFNIIKNCFAEIDLVEFKDLPVADQVAKVGELRTGPLRKVTDAEIGAFVLLFRLQYGLVQPGSEAHFALRRELGIPDPAGWAKTPAPTSFPVLFSTWLEEYQTATAATKFVDHAALWSKDGDPAKSVASRREALAAAIRHALGMGGLEDVLDPRAITVGEPTMDLLVSGAEANLQIQYPHWFDEKTGELLQSLPAGINGASKVELDILEQIERAKRKAEQRRLLAEEERNRRKAELAARFGTAIAKLKTDPAFNAATEAALTLSFGELKDLLNADAVVPAPEGLTADEVKTAFTAVIAAAKPAWFRSKSDGTPVIRRGEPRAGESRQQRAIRANLTRMINKYGKDEVAALYATL